MQSLKQLRAENSCISLFREIMLHRSGDFYFSVHILTHSYLAALPGNEHKAWVTSGCARIRRYSQGWQTETVRLISLENIL